MLAHGSVMRKPPSSPLRAGFLAQSASAALRADSRTLFLGDSCMASITVLLHTENDALRLGRALETVYACDDILVVDHASRDATVCVAREYGATVLAAVPGASPEEYLRFARPGWILCLDPREALTERLAASLFEWKS